MANIEQLTLDYDLADIGKNGKLIHADCLEWLSRLPENSIQAVVTDPPYGVKEYDLDQLEKMAQGNGGIWRLPPSFDGHTRSPLPRFTALDSKERQRISQFFEDWGRLLEKAMCPGAHLMIATNAFISQLIYGSLVRGGLEFRGEIIRTVRTMRGGDRPKNAEEEFKDVCSLPRGCFEPWGLFRKAFEKRMKVSDCLREYGTGGLRRRPDGRPFEDLIPSERTPKTERQIANHPSLKPQSYMRRLVYAALPLGVGIVVDPFAGSGSTIGAGEALNIPVLGVEKNKEYFEMAKRSALQLSKVTTKEDREWASQQLEMFGK